MTHSEQSTESSSCTVLDFPAQRLPPNRSTTHALVGRELEIMSAARAGSTSAFDELQRLYSSRLFKMILRITKNREDAEDALQDTFLRAFVAIGHFEGRSSVYSWLSRIAINSALMILRRRRCRPEASFVACFEEGEGCLPLDIKDSASNPEQLCDMRQRRKHLLHAIRKLEPRLRAAIEIQLAGTDAMKDIAETLNISVAAVKARLYRARVRLVGRAPARPAANHEVRRRVSPHTWERRLATCGEQ